MHSVIHSKPISILTLLSAISYALISIFTPVSSAFATVSASENMTFSVVVSDTPTLTLVLESNNLALNLTPGMATATFGSDDFDVTVGTSNSAGYSLTMTASSSNLSSTNGYSIASLNEDRTNFPDGYTESNFTTNSWGFKRNSGIYAGENYQPVTTDETYINSSTVPTNGVTSNVTFASKVDHTIPAGAYSTTLTFVATANVVASTCDPGYICYDDNDADSPTKMANQSATSNEDTTLWASNFQYKDHGFLGWNTQADGLGTMYGPNETVNVDLTAGGLQLYATWLPKSTQYTMQNFTDGVCKTKLVATTVRTDDSGSVTGFNVSPNSVIALEDERDGNVYAVARLADGNCWMIENLRLDNSETYASVTQEFNANNTHNPNLPLANERSAEAITASSNRLSASNNGPWCASVAVYCFDKSYLRTDNTVSPANYTMTSPEGNVYSYGNYYNWYSATAGHSYFGIPDNTDVAGDICPLNWRLPTNGKTTKSDYTQSDYYRYAVATMSNLAPTVHSDTTSTLYEGETNASKVFRSYPNNFVFAGRVLTTEIEQRGPTSGVAGYHSATSYNNGVQLFNIWGTAWNGNANIVNITLSSGMHIGRTIRCLAGN